MSYRLEVAPAGDITSVVNDVGLLWTQLPDISWGRVQRELTPWYERMAHYGVIVASKRDYNSEVELRETIETCILHFTAVGDLVVDPFCGSSTVGQVALLLGRHYFGCDISQIAIDNSETKLHAYA